MRVGLNGDGLTQTPVDLVPGVEESLDRLAVASAPLLVSGLQLPKVANLIRRSVIAARLSRTTLQPLERALTDVPNAKDGYEDVAPAPGSRRRVAADDLRLPERHPGLPGGPRDAPDHAGTGGDGTGGADRNRPRWSAP